MYQHVARFLSLLIPEKSIVLATAKRVSLRVSGQQLYIMFFYSSLSAKMSDLPYSGLVRNWGALTALAESSELPPQTWVPSVVHTAKDSLKEAWNTAREFLRGILTSDRAIIPSGNGFVDYDPVFDREERLLVSCY